MLKKLLSIFCIKKWFLKLISRNHIVIYLSSGYCFWIVAKRHIICWIAPGEPETLDFGPRLHSAMSDLSLFPLSLLGHQSCLFSLLLFYSLLLLLFGLVSFCRNTNARTFTRDKLIEGGDGVAWIFPFLYIYSVEDKWKQHDELGLLK